MADQWQQGRQTFVGRLRVRGRKLDPVVARLRLAALLSGAHLCPAGLAPSAILCVRHLRGPAPDSLSPRAACGVLSPDWERAVAASLGELARRAARPAQGAVPANAEAVLFADQAELLACLAHDYCEDSAAARWWWPGLFRGAEVVTPLKAMLDAPAHVPAALEHLARRGEAAVFARRLAGVEARALLLSVARVFALPQLQAALDAAFDAGHRPHREAGEEGARDGAPHESRDDSSPGGSDAPRTFVEAPARAAPWHAAAPEGAGLMPEQQALLGVGLMLVRAPAFVRTQIFARDTRRWLLDAFAFHDAERAADLRSPPAAWASDTRRRTSQAPRAGATEESRVVALEESKAAVLCDELTTGATSSEAETGVAGVHAAGVETANQRRASHAEITSDARASSVRDSAATFQKSEGQVESPLSTFVDDQHAGRHAQTRWSEEGAWSFKSAGAARPRAECLETKLGGIFYLINLALFLELYGDFTSPNAPGIPLSPWDFIALAGAELAGASFHADPLCALLARLAGREEAEVPGAGYAPPDEWRVPAAWLQPFAAHVELTWAARAGRLRLRHPEGFLLLDLPLKGESARASLARETEAYRSHFSFDLRRERAFGRSKEVREADALKRWVAWLMPYARARLRLALGLASADDLTRVLCERPARVLASATHVDVFFSLAALPVEVRLSGIDRDPGWVPAAGRFIAFHYE